MGPFLFKPAQCPNPRCFLPWDSFIFKVTFLVLKSPQMIKIALTRQQHSTEAVTISRTPVRFCSELSRLLSMEQLLSLPHKNRQPQHHLPPSCRPRVSAVCLCTHTALSTSNSEISKSFKAPLQCYPPFQAELTRESPAFTDDSTHSLSKATFPCLHCLLKGRVFSDSFPYPWDLHDT